MNYSCIFHQLHTGIRKIISSWAMVDPNRAGARRPRLRQPGFACAMDDSLIQSPNWKKCSPCVVDYYIVYIDWCVEIHIFWYLHAYCLYVHFFADVSRLTPWFVGHLPILACPVWFVHSLHVIRSNHGTEHGSRRWQATNWDIMISWYIHRYTKFVFSGSLNVWTPYFGDCSAPWNPLRKIPPARLSRPPKSAPPPHRGRPPECWPQKPWQPGQVNAKAWWLDMTWFKHKTYEALTGTNYCFWPLALGHRSTLTEPGHDQYLEYWWIHRCTLLEVRTWTISALPAASLAIPNRAWLKLLSCRCFIVGGWE